MPSRPRLGVSINKLYGINPLRRVVAWAQVTVCWLSRLGTLPALPDDAPWCRRSESSTASPGALLPLPLVDRVPYHGSIVPSLTVARAVL